MLEYTIGVCQSDGTLIGAEEFEEEWNREHLRRIRSCRERSLAPSNSYVARRVLALLLATEGLSFADGALCFSRDLNTPFMPTFWNFGIMIVMPMLLAVLFVHTEAFFKTYYKGSGDHNKGETNFENLKVTRRLEETVEYHNNAEENNFLENAFYIMAFFALVIGWLAFQLGIRFGREEVPEQLGDQRGNGLQAPLLQQDDQRGLLCEDSPEVQHGAVHGQGDGALGDDPADDEGEWMRAADFEETPIVVRLHRRYKANGVEYSEELLRHWETHREVSARLLEEFEELGTAAAAASNTEFDNGAATDPGAQVEEVWLVGRGSAFHKASCGMVKKGQAQGKTRSLSRVTAVAQGYKSCGQCKP